jgi:N-formylglutamate amidohydrolase
MDDLSSHHSCYALFMPRAGKGIPLVIDSPHSGRSYPADFGYACPQAALERAEDNDVDILFESAPEHGASLLCALFPRTYIDVNRAETDIDADLLAEPWPASLMPSSRSHAGIGLIRRLVQPGLPVYDRRLPVLEIRRRLDRYYHPYHKALKHLMDDAHYRFGKVWHINCHSMPSSTALTTGPRNLHHLQPDFVLGDRDGTSCAPDFTHGLRDILKSQGYRVAINNPYKGVEIVRRYSRPAAGRHSIQIEINKALYWNEEQNQRGRNFSNLKTDIDKFLSSAADYVSSRLVNLAAD